jgi:hypothetical protein
MSFTLSQKSFRIVKKFSVSPASFYFLWTTISDLKTKQSGLYVFFAPFEKKAVTGACALNGTFPVAK